MARVPDKDSTGIGGFLPLELPTGGALPHAGGQAYSTGRAAFRALLELRRPRRVHLPFYTCEAMIEPLRQAGVEWRFFAISRDLEPVDPPEPGPQELLVVNNYLGIQDALVDAWSGQLGDRLVVDDTQAFFRSGRRDAWSFNSARKFLGVPDGAWLFGPELPLAPAARRERVEAGHLLGRLVGDPGAYALFRRNEGLLDAEILGMSTLSERLLRGVDMASVAARRVENYQRLHAILGGRNQLPIAGRPGGVPLAYPFLPGREIPRPALHAEGLFVGTFWPWLLDPVLEPGRFEWERQLARELLLLPVDHRYGAGEMERVAAIMERMLEG